ncbi:alpha/beta fold hydrolase [Alicyclobacillus mengziensis]|uniref:Alpha/beta hydrolase n=1 Tax=Alicyclobacillus mengziensis TaxID=2931921 RepID=A0A9X7Z7C5_9BACL|nr:alpha/beta hydrolase [Alicyclobacillus mengziensis]QSO48257.1 alpha/beta hydrolase [Alicyclobacillus mengziensis]
MSTMTVNGVSLYYVVKGQGIPIILIHPPVLTSISFAAQLRELSQECQTIAFDIRGHGKSQESAKPVTYPLIASDMKELMSGLGIEKAFLCGYSTGGSIVLEFLLRYPERAYGGIIVSGISEVHDLRLKTRMLLGMVVAKLGAMRTLALSLAWSNSERSMFWKTFQDAKKGNNQNAAEYYRYSLTYNCTDQLSEIKSPVLLVYGDKDKGFHSYGQLLHRLLPHNEFVYIRDVKHQIPSKAATAFHEVVKKFIDSPCEVAHTIERPALDSTGGNEGIRHQTRNTPGEKQRI